MPLRVLVGGHRLCFIDAHAPAGESASAALAASTSGWTNLRPAPLALTPMQQVYPTQVAPDGTVTVKLI